MFWDCVWLDGMARSSVVPAYELRDVRKDYGARTVVEVGQLDVEPGEVLAVLGPSGAGKSTLLRMLNFLEPLSSGSIAFEGCKVEVPCPLPLRRRMTMVFQRPILLRRTLRQNVAYGLALRGVHSDETINPLLERLELKGLEQVPSRSLSGGEMQRVALARALVLRPQVLLLDEPTANLDPANVALIERMIRELRGERRMTIVLATHNVHQARRLADRVGLLIEGRFVEVGETDRFFNNPADGRTAAFLGGDMVY